MGKRTALRPRWEKAFMAALRQGLSVHKAAGEAGISPGTIYSRRRTNGTFDQACDKAIAAGGRTPRSLGFTRISQWKKPFLEALAETSNVSAAAARINIPTATVYRLRRDNPAFAEQWRAALYEGYEHLEMEVLAHLRGTDPDRKRDVANAIRLLNAHRKTVAEIRAIREDEDEQAVLDSIDALIDRMREEADAANDNSQEGAQDTENPESPAGG